MSANLGPFTEEDRKEWLREQHRVEQTIRNAPGIQHDLARVSKIKAEQEEILHILALIVRDDHLSWRRTVRRKKAELESLADQLETVANHAERVMQDPLTRGQFWFALFGKTEWSTAVDNPTVGSQRFLIRRMRHLAEYHRGRARLFGKLLRNEATRQRRQSMAALCHAVSRIGPKNLDDAVARLLNDAHEAVGLSKVFSAAQVKKFRQRHLPVVPKARKTRLLQLLGLLPWDKSAPQD